jgi:hypothetical protein
MSQNEHQAEALQGDGYPGYQLYKDTTDTIYCSKKKFRSHDEGKEWVRDCLAAHPGTSCVGKPWISNSQSGTIWPA